MATGVTLRIHSKFFAHTSISAPRQNTYKLLDIILLWLLSSSVQRHMLSRFRNSSGNSLATYEDMLSTRYTPLMNHGEVNETNQVW